MAYFQANQNRSAVQHSLQHQDGPIISNTKLDDLLNSEIEAQRGADGNSMALLLIRMDHYDRLSGQLGLAVVERIRRDAIQRIATVIDRSDLVFDIAGGYLAVLQRSLVDPMASHDLAKRILKSLHRPLRRSEHLGGLAASLGIAMYPHDGESTALLLERAEAALQRTDKWGGNGFCFHDVAIGREVAAAHAFDQEVQFAIERDALDLHFEPVLDVKRGQIVAAIGHLAWHHPNHGALKQDALLASAERLGLVTSLQRWMLERASRQAAIWRRIGVSKRVGVDLLRHVWRIESVAGLLKAAAAKIDVPLERLELRIDQGLIAAMIADHGHHDLKALVNLGVEITVTGLGVGTIDLESLIELPCTRLELAPSLFGPSQPVKGNKVRLQTLIRMADSLGKPVRAAGIETRDQLVTARSIGAFEIGGSILQPPLAVGDLVAEEKGQDANPGMGIHR